MQQERAEHESSFGRDVFLIASGRRREENRVLLVRLASMCIALGLASILALSFWLEPDPRGLGTHERLMLRPCNFYATTGLPCPSCGMTTAFANMAHGRVQDAFLAQPLGALGFIVCALLLPVALGAAISGKNFFGAFAGLPWYRLSWALGVVFVAAWVFKIVVMIAQ